jgi:hypothetical protein
LPIGYIFLSLLSLTFLAIAWWYQVQYFKLRKEKDKIWTAWQEGRAIMLPVPIEAPVYVPYRYKDLDGSIDEGVEELHLSGYLKEDDREFYLTYDDTGSCDIEPDELYTSREEAEAELGNGVFDKETEQKCRICGCTQNNACVGGCYWVEKDLCSKCAQRKEMPDA